MQWTKSKKTRWMRLVISAVATGLAVFLVLSTPGRLPSLGSFSPFVALGTLLSGWTVGWSLVPAVLVLLLMFWRHRVFCRFLCPLGFGLRLIDTVGRFFRRWRSRGERFGVVGRASRLPQFGIILFVAAMVTAVFHGPSLLWLDPLSIFVASFCMTSFSVVALMLLVPVGMTLFFPGSWCAKACPLGAMQDLIVRFERVLGRRFRKKVAIERVSGGSATKVAFSRRGAVKVLLGGLCGGLLIARERLESMWTVVQVDSSKEKELWVQPFLRPPGARAEPFFQSLCTRCGSCMRSCPSQVLSPSRSTSKGLLTPRLVIGSDYCREDCANCSAACPSGAIVPFSVEQKASFPIGIAKLEAKYCLLYNDRECERCQWECPTDAITFAWSEAEYLMLPVVDESKCTGCGACEVICLGSNSYEREENPRLPVVMAIHVVAREG